MRRARGSLFKRTRNGVLEDVWSISYHANGRRITERAYRDRAASDQLLSKRLRESALEETGLLDPRRKQRARPIKQHLDDFVKVIEGRGCTDGHAKQLRRRLTAAIAGMHVVTADDLKLDASEVFLGTMLKDRRRAARTRDHYAAALTQFGAWLVDVDRLARNPFAKLRRIATQADARRERQALTAEQVMLLVAAAEQRPVQGFRESHPIGNELRLARIARAGRRRGLLYLFSALTGLRKAECASIRWVDLQLTGPLPMVSPRAAATKSRRFEPLPLVADLAVRLLELRRELARLRGKLPKATDAVFAVPKHISDYVRWDAEFAGLQVVDSHGRRIDFHALRATCATLMARAGVPMQVARRLMRHITPAMTARHYEKLEQADLRVGAEQMAAAFRAALAAPVSAISAANDHRPPPTAAAKRAGRA